MRRPGAAGQFFSNFLIIRLTWKANHIKMNAPYKGSVKLEEEQRRREEYRWRMVVYPSLFAFIILASYGFMLITGMVNHLDNMAGYMKEMSKAIITMQDTMIRMEVNVRGMTRDTHVMSGNTTVMANAIIELTSTTGKISTHTETMIAIAGKVNNLTDYIAQIRQDFDRTNREVHQMNRSMLNMNKQVGTMSRPLSWFPW